MRDFYIWMADNLLKPLFGIEWESITLLLSIVVFITLIPFAAILYYRYYKQNQLYALQCAKIESMESAISIYEEQQEISKIEIDKYKEEAQRYKEKYEGSLDATDAIAKDNAAYIEENKKLKKELDKLKKTLTPPSTTVVNTVKKKETKAKTSKKK